MTCFAALESPAAPVSGHWCRGWAREEAQISGRSLKIYLDFFHFRISRSQIFLPPARSLLFAYYINSHSHALFITSRQKMCLCVYGRSAPARVEGGWGETFYYFSALWWLFMGENKKEAHGTSDFDFIPFYWHHDSLNLFINLSCARHVVSLFEQPTQTQPQRKTSSRLSWDIRSLSRSFITNSEGGSGVLMVYLLTIIVLSEVYLVLVRAFASMTSYIDFRLSLKACEQLHSRSTQHELTSSLTQLLQFP